MKTTLFRPFVPTFVALSLVALSLGAGDAGAAETPPGEVRMSLERFERLMTAAQRTDGPLPTWGKGEVRLTLPAGAGDVARVEVGATLRVVGDGVAEVALLPAEIVLEAARIGGVDATLAQRSGAHVALLPPDERDTSIWLRYLVPVRETADGSRVAVVALPPLPGAALLVEGARAGDAVDVWPGADLVRRGDEVRVSLPAVAAAVVRWGGAIGGHRVRRVDYDFDVNERIDAADVTATFDVVVGADSAEVPVAAASAALMDAKDGDAPLPVRLVNGWHTVTVRGAGRHTLTIRIRVPVDRAEGQPQATLQLGGASITRITAEVPGERAVHLDPAVPLESTTLGEGDHARTRVVGFLPPIDGVTVRWTEPRPSEEMAVRVNTETFQLVTIQEGVMRSRVFLRFSVLRGKTKELSIALPEGVVLYKVAGEGIDDWRTFAKTESQPRQVRVFLARELEGDYALQLELETVIPKEEGAPLDVPVVRPLGAFRETGVVALFDGDKVGFAPAEQTLYAKVGEDALPVDIRQTLTDRVSQAFKHVGVPGPLASKVAAAKEREVRFDASVETLYHVKEGAIVGQATVLVELKSGRQDVVWLALPADVNVLDITAPSLNRHEDVPAEGLPVAPGEGRKVHEVRFTRTLEGAITIYVEFERLLDKDPGTAALPDIRVLGAEVEEGSFGVTADAGIEVLPVGKPDLRQVPVAELPKAVRMRSPGELLFGYRYARAPWALDVAIKRHRTVETLKAVIDAAWLDTVVLEDGHIVTRALYQVRNDDRKFLRLMMPEGNKVWTVAAGGEPVKAVADESGALAIPLETGETLVVEVVYEVGFAKFSVFGSLDLAAPHPDLVVKGMQWRVLVPADVTVQDVDTELKEAADAWSYREPEYVSPSGGLPVDEQDIGETQSFVFTRAVYDPAEPPLSVSFSLMKAPDASYGWLALLVALALLCVPAWRRARRQPFGRLGGAALAVGALLLVLKGAVWHLAVGEVVLVIGVLLAVAVVSYLLGRREARTS